MVAMPRDTGGGTRDMSIERSSVQTSASHTHGILTRTTFLLLSSFNFLVTFVYLMTNPTVSTLILSLSRREGLRRDVSRSFATSPAAAAKPHEYS